MAAVSVGTAHPREPVVTCLFCGFENVPTARFCAGCGRVLDEAAAAPRASERRQQITVVFCDLVGSTELSQALDPEDLRDLLADYQRVCVAAVSHHDGYVAQFLGDGVVAYFGFPRAHEDDARRALRCGLDILSEMHARRGSAGPGAPQLQARVGAHTGRVVVGAVGPNREYLAQGEVPNIAARVQAEAEPGMLAVTDATWRIVKGYFRGESLGERRLKGLAEPLRLWRVTGASGAESRLEMGGELTLYVGRSAERAVLEQEWSVACSGTARFVVVQGEAGIGKSRLVQEFRQQLAESGVDQLVLRSTPYTQDSAFHPIIELIKLRLDLHESLSLDARLDRIDERLAQLEITSPDAGLLLADLLAIPAGDHYPPLDMSPARRRLRTLELLTTMVQRLAAQNPTVLVAEDLHWADASTLEGIRMLVRSGPRLPLLGLFTARPEFEPSWAGEGAATHVELARLEVDDVEAMARAVANGKRLPGELLRLIGERADGVPLFVEEIVRAVIESGVLEEHELSWELKGALPADLIPMTVDASLLARIDNLGDSRATAQLAATIGREFSWKLLRLVSDRSEDALGNDIERLLSSGLAWPTSPTGGETYAFKHALVQEASYESLLRAARQAYHERIARVLTGEFADEFKPSPEVVARHLSGAGRHLEASDYWAAAGQNALGRLAIPEAHGHFTRALEDLKKLPETPETLEKELDLQIAIAPTLMTVNGWASPTVAATCERAQDLCRQLERPDKLYPAVWGLWTNLFVGGLLDRALVSATQALDMALASGLPLLEVTGRHAVAYTHYYRGEWAETLPHAEAGIALYSVEQERALTAMFQLSSTVNLVAALGSSYWMIGNQDRALEELERMIAIARDMNHPSALSNALGVACYMLTFHHDAERMLGYADELKGFAREEGWDLWYAVGVMSSGWSRLRLDDRDDGLRELFEGVALFRDTHSYLMGPTVAVIHAEGLRAAGRHEEALEMLAETAESARRGHVGVLLPDVHRIAGEIQADLGRLDEAEAELRRALDTAAAQTALSLELRAALSYLDLLERTGRGREAIGLVKQLYGRFDEGFAQPDLIRARMVLEAAGQLERTAG